MNPPTGTPPSDSAFASGRAGLVIVDHGSRKPQSNQLLLEVVAAFRRHSGWPIVEPAHMELAEPSIATAFARCVEQGARLVAVFPYLLAPGRHWQEDIPRLAAEAAKAHAAAGVRHLVTAPLGLHEAILALIERRATHCVARVSGDASTCDVCAGGGGCTMHHS
jgi:sirohydrochlorin ferrochelatase